MNKQITPSVPVGGANAIESVTFMVRLGQAPNPEATNQLDADFDALGDELPGKVAAPGLPAHIAQAAFGAMNMPFLPLGEWTRFHAKSNGAHTWRVTVQGPAVMVVCHSYTKYREVWARAQKYLGMVMKRVADVAPVLDVSLQFVDKFHYPANQDNLVYDMADLFRKDTPYLTQQCWNVDVMWHVYQGWFDRSAAPYKHLNQLNLSNVRLDNGTFATVIDHRLVTSDANDGIMTLDAGQLEGIFDTLHKGNIAMIKSLLTDEKLLEIGLRGNA